MAELKILQTDRRTIPNQRDMMGTEIRVVLKADTGGGPCEYAAYIGAGDEEWVAQYGVKLSYAEAHLHFPGIRRELYRT